MSSKVKGLVNLLRPANSVMMGGAVLVGELIAHENIFLSPPTFLGFITSFTLTGASMVANDYWDRFVDKVNAPKRPIPSGIISERTAIPYSILLILIGLVVAFFTNLTCFIIAVVALVVSMGYNYKGKEMGLIGNFMVSACVAIPLFYGGFLYRGFSLNFKGLWSLSFFTVMAFLANTGREVMKGIVDVEGDKLRNVRTVAISYGTKFAAIIAVSFYMVAVGLSAFPWLLSLVSWFYIPSVLASDVGFTVSSFILLRNYSKDNAKKVKNMVLIWMLLGLLAFIAGGL